MRFLIAFLLVTSLSWAQETTGESSTVTGIVLSTADEQPLEGVNIVNLTQVKGAITNAKGEFEVRAAVNDTLFFSYLGHKSINVKVNEDWTTYGDVQIKMTEVGFALEEVVVRPIPLTGILEVDAKQVPIYTDFRYQISGLPTGYEAGSKSPSGFSSVLGAIFNPADFLYNLFGKKPRQLRKLRQMREDDNVRNLLLLKFDRETLLQLLLIDRVDLDELLRQCNYSAEFVQRANDLQVLDAISDCYEEYKVLKDKN